MKNLARKTVGLFTSMLKVLKMLAIRFYYHNEDACSILEWISIKYCSFSKMVPYEHSEYHIC